MQIARVVFARLGKEMPYEKRKEGNKWCVFKKGTNKKFGCHDTPEEADNQIRALHANVKSELEVRLLKKHAEA